MYQDRIQQASLLQKIITAEEAAPFEFQTRLIQKDSMKVHEIELM